MKDVRHKREKTIYHKHSTARAVVIITGTVLIALAILAGMGRLPLHPAFSSTGTGMVSGAISPSAVILGLFGSALIIKGIVWRERRPDKDEEG